MGKGKRRKRKEEMGQKEKEFRGSLDGRRKGIMEREEKRGRLEREEGWGENRGKRKWDI